MSQASAKALAKQKIKKKKKKPSRPERRAKLEAKIRNEVEGKSSGKGAGKGQLALTNEPWTPKGGKAAGKGGKKRQDGSKAQTPDRQPICFGYNRSPPDCSGGCGLVHACWFCMATDHAGPQCPNKPGA